MGQNINMSVEINGMVTTFFMWLIIGEPLTSIVSLHSNLKCKVRRPKLDAYILRGGVFCDH